MPKPVITDEQVKRAEAAYMRGWTGHAHDHPAAIRRAVEAALSPSEPEVEVTEEMLLAANLEWNTGCENFVDLYRAMHAARPREKGECEHEFTSFGDYMLRCHKCGEPKAIGGEEASLTRGECCHAYVILNAVFDDKIVRGRPTCIRCGHVQERRAQPPHRRKDDA